MFKQPCRPSLSAFLFASLIAMALIFAIIRFPLHHQTLSPPLAGKVVKEVSREGLKERSPRVFVMVMTTAAELNSSGRAIYETWGSRCDKILFFTPGNTSGSKLPTYDLKVKEGLNNLNEKMMKGFRHIYQNYFNQFDWFMKADTDTYVIVENLKRFLASKNTSKPVYYGRRLRDGNGIYFHSGGAGYVLSKEALRRLATEGSKPQICQQTGGMEDVYLALCLSKLGANISHAQDEFGKSLFHSFNLTIQLSGRFEFWYPSYAIDNKAHGPQTISQFPITFHRVKNDECRAFHFLLYTIRVNGGAVAQWV